MRPCLLCGIVGGGCYPRLPDISRPVRLLGPHELLEAVRPVCVNVGASEDLSVLCLTTHGGQAVVLRAEGFTAERAHRLVWKLHLGLV